MGVYNDLDRASRDPYYRISYEAERRHEKIEAEVTEILKRDTRPSGGAKTTQSSGFDFSFPGSSSTPASDPISDEAFGAGLVIVALFFGGFYAFVFVASHWRLILECAGILAFLAVAALLAVRFWQTVGAFITPPLMWACWLVVGALLLLEFEFSGAVTTLGAALPALWLGTAIWPRQRPFDDWGPCFLAAAQWLCMFIAFFLVMILAGSILAFDLRIGVGAGFVAAGIVWLGFYLAQRSLAPA